MSPGRRGEIGASSRRWALIDTLILSVLCGVFAAQAIWVAATTSATNDEPPHLAAGYTYLRWHDYRLNVEHPPLVKKLAALPLLAARVWPPDLDLTRADLEAGASSPSLRRAKLLWTAALARTPYQWAFGNQLLYGVRDEVLARVSADERWTVPTTIRLEARDFLNDGDRLLFLGRLPIIGLGVLLGILIFSWARQLWGRAGAVLALSLYALDPNFIANSAVVTTDVGVTLGMFGALYFLWRASRVLRVGDVLGAVLFFGVAFTAKFSAILLVPSAALVVLGRVLSRRPWPMGARERLVLHTPGARLLAGAGLLVISLGAAYGALWAAYEFRYSAAADPARAARAEALIKLPPELGLKRDPGHFAVKAMVTRMATGGRNGPGLPETSGSGPRTGEPSLSADLKTWLLLGIERHHVLPEAFLYGLSVAEINSYTRPSFLRGQWSDVGFRTYFLWTFLLKTPIFTLAAMIGAVVTLVATREPWATRASFLVIPVLVYWGMALGWTLNIGHRHLLPIYPFLFVMTGSLGQVWRRIPEGHRRWTAGAVLAAAVCSPLVVFSPPWRPTVIPPHYLAYFNELAGGPAEGYRSLVDANLDWGQDLKRLRRWLDEHGVVEPINLSYFGMADPLYYGIRHVNMPGGFLLGPKAPLLRDPAGRAVVPGMRVPGYLVVSATNLMGVYMSPDERAMWTDLLARARLVDRVGYSLFVFRLDAP